jgi:DNA-binding transcriptional ArsR family regulator
MRSMEASPDLSRLAGTVGDARRIQMLALLMEGRALTAKELALGSGIEPATATAHLRRLLDDGLVASTAQGRHKYFRLANHQVAQLVEALMRVAARRPNPLPRRAPPDPIREARFCYDHLAGSLGTGLLAAMSRKGWLLAAATDAMPKALTPKGDRDLNALGLCLPAVRSRRRQFACSCLDWSERQDHLGGALGAALAAHFTDAGWIVRKKHTRVVSITAEGRVQLARLGIKLPAVAA